MSVEANKVLIRRVFTEAVNRGEMAVIDEVFSPNFIDYSTEIQDTEGPAGIKTFLHAVRRTFPDLTVTVDALIGEGEQVASRETWLGTHAITGQCVQGTVLHLFVFRGNQVVEEWSKGWDSLNEDDLTPE